MFYLQHPMHCHRGAQPQQAICEVPVRPLGERNESQAQQALGPVMITTEEVEEPVGQQAGSLYLLFYREGFVYWELFSSFLGISIYLSNLYII